MLCFGNVDALLHRGFSYTGIFSICAGEVACEVNVFLYFMLSSVLAGE